MTYVALSAAIVMEILGTTSMKYSNGFTKLWPTAATVACYVLAFTLLAQTLKTMDMGIAYAIWAGAGTALIAMIGIAFMNEPASAAKLVGVTLVVAGVAVLNVQGAH